MLSKPNTNIPPPQLAIATISLIISHHSPGEAGSNPGLKSMCFDFFVALSALLTISCMLMGWKLDRQKRATRFIQPELVSVWYHLRSSNVNAAFRKWVIPPQSRTHPCSSQYPGVGPSHKNRN